MTAVPLASGAEAVLDDGVLMFACQADSARWLDGALAAGWVIDNRGRVVAPYRDLPPVALRLAVKAS